MSFCTECGTENTKVFFTGEYDWKTGEPIMRLVCPNENKCPTACEEFAGGHVYRWWFAAKCSRCGYGNRYIDY